jgi:hypothetical protein
LLLPFLAKKVGAGLIIKTDPRWRNRGLRGPVRYIVNVNGIVRVFKFVDETMAYLEGVRDGRLTCPCVACQDHFRWVRIRHLEGEAPPRKHRRRKKRKPRK